MEDKRITKTKLRLKNALSALLQQETFERITVTSICNYAKIGRVTFYTHYDDKYALAIELFSDYSVKAIELYHVLQAENNTEGEVVQGYLNMLDCILNTYAEHYDFFSEASLQKNPYLFSIYYRLICENVERHIKENMHLLRPKYPANQTAALLCNGIWSVLALSGQRKPKKSSIYHNARAMYLDLISSALFSRVEG